MRKSDFQILIIDDEIDLADIIKVHLEMDDYNVDTVSDGETALQMIAKKPYNFILCDIRMAKMSGIEVLKKIREMKNYNPAVIMYSGEFQQAGVSSKDDLLKLGATDFIAKPLKIGTLTEKIENLFTFEST